MELGKGHEGIMKVAEGLWKWAGLGGVLWKSARVEDGFWKSILKGDRVNM